MDQTPRNLPQGALPQADGSVVWRVWAPRARRVTLVLDPEGQAQRLPMQPVPGGYFECHRPDVRSGLRYAYALDEGPLRPDPASRWQPDGVHRPSAVFFPDQYRWGDASWRGVPRDELVIYELHVGAFTPEGTFDAIIPRLPQLAELGITAIELMPVAQFPGDRNWGYDGVHLFAPQNTYGGPEALQRLVDAAHQAGLAVLQDVVYNHLGPEGNYLAEFGPYFTEAYHTPWGAAVNYDGPDCDAVRRLVCDNARMWIRDFHMDGLRLDAVQTIYDFSARHILAELQEAAQCEAARAGRRVHVIAETNQNDVRLVQPTSLGGYGLCGVWSDDFHHAVHAVLTGERDGYYEDFGLPEDVAKAFNDVFVYDGRYSRFRRRTFGSRVGNLDRSHFVVCTSNHDQVGNRARGDRALASLPPGAARLAAGLLLLQPCIPMLFMGQEYGEQRPFPFFCSFGDPDLTEAVRRGRRAEFEDLKFRWGTDIPDPHDRATFESARLTWSWPSGSPHAALRQLYRDLLAARAQWPALRDRQHTLAYVAYMQPLDGAGARQPVLVVQRGAPHAAESLMACANLSGQAVARPALDLAGRTLLMSTEQPRYGGQRAANDAPDGLLAYELLLWGRS